MVNLPFVINLKFSRAVEGKNILKLPRPTLTNLNALKTYISLCLKKVSIGLIFDVFYLLADGWRTPQNRRLAGSVSIDDHGYWLVYSDAFLGNREVARWRGRGTQVAGGDHLELP